VTEAEVERARAAYTARAGVEHPYRWDNPGYVAYIQRLERDLLRALADAAVKLAGARVLEVGCGTGYFLERLRQFGAGESYGIDLMEDRIAEGRERYPALHLQVGNAAELPFADGEFDLVTQFTCLSSIVDGDVRAAAAREMLRLARRGGWVLSFDFRGVHPLGRRRPAKTDTVPLDERELRRLFGAPLLLRRVAMRFDLAQLAGRHDLVAAALAALPPLRSHLLGIWRAGGR
jgi:SAM-dependent methyltransferase